MKSILLNMKKMIDEKQTNKLTMLGEVEKEGDPFKVLISTILSSRTKDDTTFGASNRLFNKYKNPEELSKAKTVDIKRLIKPVAFYKTKSKKIKQVAEIIHKEYNDDVPIEMEELLDLPLVGRKTANVVLNEGFGLSTIAVDTHIFRVSNRTSLAFGKNPDQVEQALYKVVPQKYLKNAHHLLLLHGRYTCKARKPLCDQCVVFRVCKFKDKINYV